MIVGTKHWKEFFYSQRNNAFEQENLQKYGVKVDDKHYSETCGPTAAINCLAALGYDLRVYTKIGEVNLQPEDMLTAWMYNNLDLLKKIRTAPIPPNRIPQYYPMAVDKLFGAEGKFVGFWKDWAKFIRYFFDGHAVQCSLPGHFIACVAYDVDKEMIIYHDSWAGPEKRMSRAQYEKEVSDWMIVYSEKS